MRVHSSDLIKGIVDNARIASAQGVPQDLKSEIIPVLEVNPRLLRVCDIVRGEVRTATGSVTLYTTPSNADFYLTAITLSAHADAAHDNTLLASIASTINGATRNLLRLAKLSLTATHQSLSISFPYPIKIDRNSTITLNLAFTAGACSAFGSFYGYIDNSSLA